MKRETRTLADRVREAIDIQRTKEIADRKAGTTTRFSFTQVRPAKPRQPTEAEIDAAADKLMGIDRGKDGTIARFSTDPNVVTPDANIEAQADFIMGVRRNNDGTVEQFSHKAPQLPGVRFVPDTRVLTEAEIVEQADLAMGINRR